MKRFLLAVSLLRGLDRSLGMGFPRKNLVAGLAAVLRSKSRSI